MNGAALVALTGANSDDFALNGLLFGCVGNDKSTSGGGLALETLDDYTVVEWSDFHSLSLFGFVVSGFFVAGQVGRLQIVGTICKHWPTFVNPGVESAKKSKKAPMKTAGYRNADRSFFLTGVLFRPCRTFRATSSFV